MLRSFLPASAVACAAASALAALCGRPILPVPSDEGGVDVEWSPYGEDVRSFLAPLFAALDS